MTTPEVISDEEMNELMKLGLRGFGEDLCTSCAGAGVGVCSLFSVLNYNESTFIRDRGWYKDMAEGCARIKLVDWVNHILFSKK